MIYTAKEGIEGKTKERFLTAELIIVPLIMFGVTAYGLMGPRGGSGDYSVPSNTSGVTLGSTTDTPASANSPNNSTANAGVGNAAAQDSSTGVSSSPSGSSISAKSPSTSGSGGATSSPSGGSGGGSGGSGGSSCPCQTISNVIKTLQPPPPPTLPPPPPPIIPLSPTAL